MKTEEVLEKISKIYYNMKGTEPVIEQKGAWIYIEGKPYRKSTIEREIEIHENIAHKPHGKPKDDNNDIRKLISTIRQDGKHIFTSNDLKKMQQAGKRIAKMAKRILNLLGDK